MTVRNSSSQHQSSQEPSPLGGTVFLQKPSSPELMPTSTGTELFSANWPGSFVFSRCLTEERNFATPFWKYAVAQSYHVQLLNVQLPAFGVKVLGVPQG